MVLRNSRIGKGAGLNWATASSMANSRVRMKMRTLTSHTSQLRSSNVDCIERSPKFQSFRGSRFQSLEGLLLETWKRCPLETSNCLSCQLGDHGEQRHVERNDDTADA